MRFYDRLYATVDLDRIKANVKAIKNHMGHETAVIGVVKTDGYGHGAVPVAKAIDPFVTGYAVALVEEGIILRKHGIIKPVLVLGQLHESRYEELLEYDITPSIFQMDKAEKLSAAAGQAGKTRKIHIAIDTGMSRLGLFPNEESADMVEEMAKLPGIEIEGLFTHFSKADERDKASTLEQIARYMRFLELLRERGITLPVRHCANSAGVIELLGTGLDAVRAGIAIYGIYPSDEVERKQLHLEPAMELKSTVSYLKVIGSGTRVSYGGTYEAQRDTTVATVAVGYGDGYPRGLSNRGSVIIHGRRAPVIGRVCMDQMMVDVTHIPDVKENDMVTLLGRDGGEEITIEEMAEESGGFHYEMLCNFGKRIPRVYIKDGKAVGAIDYFSDVYKDFMA